MTSKNQKMNNFENDLFLAQQHNVAKNPIYG